MSVTAAGPAARRALAFAVLGALAATASETQEVESAGGLGLGRSMRIWSESTPSAATQWIVLAGAAPLGLIPESGSHLLFVTLCEQGLVPLGTLVASSIVQDGHGTLPLLAYSRSDFLKVKVVNLAVGLAIGAVMMALAS